METCLELCRHREESSFLLRVSEILKDLTATVGSYLQAQAYVGSSHLLLWLKGNQDPERNHSLLHMKQPQGYSTAVGKQGARWRGLRHL